MPDRQENYSMMSFRPSSYSTGIQPLQSYTPAWPEGAEYGSWLPFGWGEDDTGAAGVGGTCVDHAGLLGTPRAKVSCADLKAALEGKEAGFYDKYEPDDGMITDHSLKDLVPGFVPDFILPDSLKPDDYCDEECEKEKKLKKIAAVAVPLLAVAGFLGWRYHTTGKVL
jgi:hypothetical protein